MNLHRSLPLVYVLLALLVLAGQTGYSKVEVLVEQEGGVALIKYQCTSGELVRSFALDVSVDQGHILDISDFFVGECTAVSQGYGIFPAAFRDHILIGPSTNINWAVEDYTPLAVYNDFPGDTLGGLDTSGATLAFGAIWDPNDPATVPAPSGTLCALHISQGATMTIGPNEARGGVGAADRDMILEPVFSPAFVQPPEITNIRMTNQVLTIEFAGGELEYSTTIGGPWHVTGETNGTYVGTIGTNSARFFRVHNLGESSK